MGWSNVRAVSAMTMPLPESGSGPGALISRAVAVRTVPISLLFRVGRWDQRRAATPAAWGAAAEVPGNGAKPGTSVLTPSAAAISGLRRSLPPVEERLLGVMAEPSGL